MLPVIRLLCYRVTDTLPRMFGFDIQWVPKRPSSDHLNDVFNCVFSRHLILEVLWFLLSENVRLEGANEICLWQARIYDPFYTLQTDNLRPSQDVLKECVNGEHWDIHCNKFPGDFLTLWRSNSKIKVQA